MEQGRYGLTPRIQRRSQNLASWHCKGRLIFFNPANFLADFFVCSLLFRNFAPCKVLHETFICDETRIKSKRKRMITTTTTIPLEGILAFLDTMTLSVQNKRWLGEQLIERAMREERVGEETSHTRRIFKVKRRSACSPSDEELSARFAGKDMPKIPSDPDWSQVIDSNAGKTIKPIEKWL